MSSNQSPRRQDGMNQDEFIDTLTQRITLAIWAAVKVELGLITRTCMNCEHWLIGSAICGKFNQLPPPHIIANGCDDHERMAPF